MSNFLKVPTGNSVSITSGDKWAVNSHDGRMFANRWCSESHGQVTVLHHHRVWARSHPPSCWKSRATLLHVTGSVSLRGVWMSCRSPAPRLNSFCRHKAEAEAHQFRETVVIIIWPSCLLGRALKRVRFMTCWRVAVTIKGGTPSRSCSHMNKFASYRSGRASLPHVFPNLTCSYRINMCWCQILD